jgi:hypothetical protein
MASRMGKAGLTATALLLAGFTSASAQQGAPKPAPQATAGPVAPGGPPPGVAMPDNFKLNMMIRTAIIGLNQANQTGNYTVLRDLGASSFRASNDPSRLAEIFAHLRKRQIDLSPILFFTPKIVQQPQIDQRGLLRLVGFFPTAPEQVSFDIYYLFEGGQWRLFGIGVLMRPAAEATAALPGQGAPNQATPNQIAPNQPAPNRAAANSAAPSQSRQNPAPAQPSTAAAPKNPPSEKPAKSAEKAAAPAKPASAKPDVEGRTTNNTARIQLGAPAASSPAARQPPSQSEGDAATPAASEKPEGGGLFPFW